MARFVSQTIICVLLMSSVFADLKDEYDHAAFLDPNEIYKLYWSVKDVDKAIHFAVQVKTTGWVGFGISAGLSGSMKGADIVIGGVDSSGKGYLKDYHGELTRNTKPIEDKKQDYDFVGSSEANGATVLKFKRKLVTCDKDDRDIPLGTTKVIFAYGQTDEIGYHMKNRGARSLNLLNYVKNVPPPKTAKYFDVLIRNVSVPSTRTTYWCQALKLSHLVNLTEKKHVIEIAPVIAKKDQGIVHHMVLYVCKDSFNETHLNVTGRCYNRNMPPSIKECAGVSPMYAWAVGGVTFKYPGHVGWPIGAADSMKYVILETHFDNPTQNKNFVVTSGLRLYYDTPRKYDAATLTTGAGTNYNMIIPPKLEKWMIRGSCTKDCSSYINDPRALPGGEVKFFASFPHAHTIANGIWTKITRNDKEIMELIRDENYDFDYQQTHLLRKEVPFKAGDELITYCRYNSMKKENVTLGGESTTEEMCFNFILYYPSVNLSMCATSAYHGVYDFQSKYGHMAQYKNFTYFKDWNGVKWNKTMVDELATIFESQAKDAVHSICFGSGASQHHIKLTDRPIVKVPLPPAKDICTNATGAAVSYRLDGLLGVIGAFIVLLLIR